MGRFYTISFENELVDAETDLFEIIAADDKPLIIHSVIIGPSIDRVGLGQEEQFIIRILTNWSFAGSGGTSVTPAPINPSDVAADFTASYNNNGLATVGSRLQYAEVYNNQLGFHYAPVEQERIWLNQAESPMTVRKFFSLTEDQRLSATMLIEELG